MATATWSTRSHCVENSICERLWTWRKTDCEINYLLSHLIQKYFLACDAVLFDKTGIDASEESTKPIFRTEEEYVKMETSGFSEASVAIKLFDVKIQNRKHSKICVLLEYYAV
jgi:hypothetical protein